VRDKGIKMNLIFSIVLWMASMPLGNSMIQDDSSRLIISTYLPVELAHVPMGSRTNLETKLNQIVSSNGFGGRSLNPRFIITPRINILSKEVTPTVPPLHVYSLEVILFVGDGIEGTLFASYSTSAKGVGRSEEQAFNAALRGIRPQDSGIAVFLDQGKQRIIAYYTSTCELTLQQVDSMVGQGQLDEAIFILMGVPEVVQSCYEKSMEKAAQVYRQKQENECQINLTKARAASGGSNWSEAASYLVGYTPDLSCYAEIVAFHRQMQIDRCSSHLGRAKANWANRNAAGAASYLSQISTNSPCSNEAGVLASEIAQSLDERERKEWDFAYEMYNRNQTMREEDQDAYIELEKRMMLFQETKGYDLNVMQVQAAREVGVAYGNNQPRNVTYNIRNW
jgi:hypothetical protein